MSSLTYSILKKPQNILVLSQNPLSVKVADFGIAKMMDQQTYLQVNESISALSVYLFLCRRCAVRQTLWRPRFAA